MVYFVLLYLLRLDHLQDITSRPVVCMPALLCESRGATVSDIFTISCYKTDCQCTSLLLMPVQLFDKCMRESGFL